MQLFSRFSHSTFFQSTVSYQIKGPQFRAESLYILGDQMLQPNKDKVQKIF